MYFIVGLWISRSWRAARLGSKEPGPPQAGGGSPLRSTPFQWVCDPSPSETLRATQPGHRFPKGEPLLTTGAGSPPATREEGPSTLVPTGSTFEVRRIYSKAHAVLPIMFHTDTLDPSIALHRL